MPPSHFPSSLLEMGVLTLNIECREKGVKKTMQFEPRTLVHDACRLIRDKLGHMPGNPNDYGLFRLEDDPTKCVWMENGRTLEYYLIRNGDTLEYKNKIRPLRVRTLDGGAIKTVFVDESQPVSQLMVVICSKMGIANHEEYSLVRGASPEGTDGGAENGMAKGERERTPYSNGGTDEARPKQRGGLEHTFMNTIGRKKERQIQQLRAKLHTDAEINWVDHSKTLREQNIGEEEELTLRRKFFFSDTNVDTRDPVQLNLLYIQCRDGVLRGLHPVSRDTAIKLAALQCYIEYGPYEEGIQRSVDAKNLLPKEYAKAKELEKNIIQEYRELMYEDSAAPKKKYCELCQSLPTYGVTFFLVKEKLPGKNRLIPRLLGVNKDSVMRVDERTKAVLKEWPLEQVRRWAASFKTFTLDFGDYKDGYYSVQTLEGERIGQLIGGYIDIILKKKRIVDSGGIEGDEGATMVEDIVAPAKATLLAHSDLAPPYPAPEGYLPHGTFRPTAETPAGAPQYGGVSGMIIAQEIPKGERIRYLDARERSQKALVGTIEATIRAVEEAEEEIQKPPQIELPQFGETQRHWRVEVEKEAVSDRLAAMGAATAEVVQLTAIPEETLDTRVGHAIATIGSNIPEMGRGVRQLAAIMPDESRAGDLMDAARKLCNAFGDFLEKVHPEKQEKRATILSAASRVGELSHDMISTMHEQTEEERTFHEELNRRARAVATSTAQLVLQAKTVSAECEEPALKDQVIHSAMKTAFATSELVACTRVVGPTIEHAPCKEHLTEAAHNVARAVQELLEDASKACQRAPPEKGQEQYGNLHDAASRVSGALDHLIGHVQDGPWGYHRKTTQDYTFEQIVESSNRIITNQGHQPGAIVRDSESAIRSSQLLVEGMEQEAQLSPAEQRNKLLNAARSVAQATSSMIDATRECQSRPGEVGPQVALRNAAEHLVQVTNQATGERQIQQTIQQLEKVSKETAASITQTVAAANSARPHILAQQPLDSLVRECADVSRYVPPLIKRIKQHQGASEAGAQFRAKVGLIHDSQAVVGPATRLVDESRSSVSHVRDKHSAGLLLQNCQQLSVNVAELRTVLNNVQQLDFGSQLDHSEELIRSLDAQLQELSQRIRLGQPLLPPSSPPLDSPQQTTRTFRQQCRLLNSTIAQMVSATHSSESRQMGTAMLEMAQALSDFADSVEDVAATEANANGSGEFAEGDERVDKVRERSTAQQLEEAARRVTESLRKTLASLPDNAIVDRAMDKLNALTVQQSAKLSPISPPPSADEFHAFAVALTESANRLPTLLHNSAEENARGINEFTTNFARFHTTVSKMTAQANDTTGQEMAERLGDAKESALIMLESLRTAQTDPNNASLAQSLSSSVRQFVVTISAIVELAQSQGTSAWLRECEEAIQQIHSVRHLFDGATTSPLNVPLNGNSYYESLAEVTNEARNLGDGMNGLAHYARRNDNEQLCLAVRQVANAVCGLAKNAAQSAYLIGVGDPQSEPGRAAIYDVGRCEQSLEAVKQLTEQICTGRSEKRQIINDTTVLASHASVLASVCRDASEQSANVGVRSQFVNCAREITSVTAALITTVKLYDQSERAADLGKCVEQANKLHSAADNLCKFVDNPDFGALPARIALAGRRAQQPLVHSSTKMLDASLDMITTAKSLDENPSDAATWQQIANSSSVVSESIKQLVAAIRDEAPGQSDLSNATNVLMQLIQQIDDAAIAAAREELARAETAVDSAHQQIQHSAQQILNSIDPLKISAISHAEAIGRNVRQQIASIQTLVVACVQAASLSYDSRTQSNLFEQCKTVLEASLQMMYATKDSGGNPKAVELHTIVEESAEQQRLALTDLQRQVQLLDSESGVVAGIIDNVSRSIALADQSRKPSENDSLVNVQAQIASLLNEMAQNASDAPLTQPEHLGTLSLRLAENYRELAEIVQIAQNLMNSPELSQRLKMSVQKLGTVLIELIKFGAQRRNYPTDQRVYQQLSQHSVLIQERIREIVAVLSEGSQGTQACINAAQTVSGIIGDLDTTILFATSGSLNPQLAPGAEFGDHRDTIVKTAKALVEDTKALVSGAASNQEQLAVAAQNAVRTILQLSEAVKCGAATLSSDSAEAQVMVIHAVRDVAAALSNLIQATTHASGRTPNDPAIGNLKEASKVMVRNVGSLLRAIKTVDDTSQRGAQALEAAINSIEVSLKQFDNSEATGRRPATAEDILRATRAVTDAATKAAGASSLLHQENLIAAANMSRQSVSDLLLIVRAAASSAEHVELKYRMLSNGRDVALNVKHLLASLLFLLTRPDDPTTKNAVLTTANEIAKMVAELAQCSDQLRSNGASTAMSVEESVMAVGNELLVAANSVEAVSYKLAQMRPREIHKPDENLTYDEQILSSAKSITQAVQTLVKAASSAQQELVAQGRVADPGPANGSEEQQWTAGLVSAAKLVAAATNQLCEAANGLVQGHSTEEKLIAAAKQVASSTAHLLVACKVKCDLNSRAMQRLQSAGHAVKTATEHLVNAARQAITQEDCRGLVISEKIVTGITQMMDAHEEVLRKERELKEARNRLAQLNRSRYEKSPEPSPEKQ
ncbi:hypothetical protein niasHS_007353 [Heterodera schachtii]|uniref:Talin n=1 Tax=Heterodera schachtii TaxID=97005 RepID=A0ABD2JK34_HETSC